MNENLALNLTDTAERHPTAVALRVDDTSMSFADLDERSARMAGVLRERGVQPGDRVGIMLPNVPEFAVVYYGALRAGAVVVPMNVLLKRREVSFYLGDSGARLLVAWHQYEASAIAGAAEAQAETLVVDPGRFDGHLDGAAALPEVATRTGSDTAVILYTSGTTGKPKGAELTHANLRRNTEVVVRMLSLGSDDVVLGALPLFHSFGQTCGLNAAIAAGACLALVPRFDPVTVLEIVERDKVDVFEGVPTMYVALLNLRDAGRFDTSSLRLCLSGGAALPVEVLHEFEDAFGCIVLEGYGLSETSPVASFNHPGRERKPGSIGTPIDGVELKVVDDDGRELPAGDIGEILIRGHNVMKGYWNRPEATAEAIDSDGWFRTGDMAKVDADGYFFIVDRKKDLIIRGGYNVYPREIEEVLYEHEAVRECAVIGVPHDVLGEEVGAAVVLKPGAEVTVADLRAYVKRQVAAYKYPRRLWLVDELPKTATGKIVKGEIQRPAAA